MHWPLTFNFGSPPLQLHTNLSFRLNNIRDACIRDQICRRSIHTLAREWDFISWSTNGTATSGRFPSQTDLTDRQGAPAAVLMHHHQHQMHQRIYLLLQWQSCFRFIYLFKTLFRKKLWQKYVYKVSGKVRNKESLRIKTLIRCQQQIDDKRNTKKNTLT